MELLEVLLVLLTATQCYVEGGILFPRVTTTREVKSLDGLWFFSLSTNEAIDPFADGLTDDRDDHDIHLMPVPSSYNDIPTTSEVRDHVGLVVYERTFYIPNNWGSDKRIWLRFGSVSYAAKAYINGKLALSHEIGHLPFAGEITSLLVNDENIIRVEVDNIPSNSTIPQGEVDTLSNGRKVLSYTYDFFDYSGIDRPVFLYTTPNIYIDDITITTKIDGFTGIVNYVVDTSETDAEISYKVKILDADKTELASSDKKSGSIQVPQANFWWPYLMHENPGYLYGLKVEIYDSKKNLIDTYLQSFGIRELAWNNTSFTINGKPIYLRGFGRHEDSDFRGKGFDLPVIIRDHNLIRWIGANAYRTSHYPYAEETMDLADRLGIMIIDESPAVNTENFNDELLENHKKAITQLYQRDKNRPSVVIWSCANEARSLDPASEAYYKEITIHIRSLESTRPITIVNNNPYDTEFTEQFVDIVSFNRYNAWYLYTGDLDVIYSELVSEGENWHKAHNKPVLITEYGGDTLEGYHSLPDYLWSEEFQVDLLANHFKAFDTLREKGWFIGEMIWNFADFRTAQNVVRLGGNNKKGIFTREREPKNSAHLLRRRYWSLAKELDNATMPSDLSKYVIPADDDDDDQPTNSASSVSLALILQRFLVVLSFMYFNFRF